MTIMHEKAHLELCSMLEATGTHALTSVKQIEDTYSVQNIFVKSMINNGASCRLVPRSGLF